MKYRYRKHLARIGQRDEKTIIESIKNIRQFEAFISFKGFESFNEKLADSYINFLTKAQKSYSTIINALRYLKDFLNWLERQKGYRSKLNYNHVEYLSLSRNQRRQAKASAYKKSYSFDQIIETIRKMPDKTEKDKRDRALIGLQALCTLRISELRTVKIRNLINENGRWFIDANSRDMETKFAKSRIVYCLPLPDDILESVLAWRDILIKKGSRESDPFFPVIDNRFNTRNLLDQKTTFKPIKSNTTIREIFKKAFTGAGYEYLNPHSFRHTIARYAQTQSPAFLNAVRQNLGHSSIDTTLNSYGQLSSYEQGKALLSQEKGVICE
ncbi:tyrosine-type recombinase/integrase [Curvivirga aplysinae]|uniref:tyrosine-type recombinase/integrase n=1 Tax=Curvivirga aplysinae TaxID=2529852 RepID=UPI001C3FB9DC|nr:tyrosine-type recombinase/integrase [Curvivirga aplysinae]